MQKETQESIVDFVKNLSFSESYEGDAESEQYPPPELNYRKLWSTWQDERKASDKAVCHYDTFCNIMKRHFNPAFDSPGPEQVFVQSVLFEGEDEIEY